MSKSYELIMTPRSPFARRVRLALRRLGLRSAMKENVIDAFDPPEWLSKESPLALIPILKVSGEENWIDSQVILENLHDETGKVWPKDPSEKKRERKLSTLAAGVMQLCVQIFLEQKKTAPDSETLDEYRTNLNNALIALEAASARMSAPASGSALSEFSQPLCDFGVAYDYLRLRVPEARVDESFPAFSALSRKISVQSDFQETAPPA